MGILLRIAGWVAGSVAAASLVTACAAAGPAPASTSTPAPRSTPAMTAPGTPAPTEAPTTAPAKAPTPKPTAAGPVTLASKVYPYSLTVPAGPTGFIDAPAAWDGAQNLSTDSRMTDRLRVPGTGLIFIAMTDTKKGIDAYADEMQKRFEAWHGCLPRSGRRSFVAGDLQGVAFAQSCANGSHDWVRALLVGDGRALVAMSDSATIDGLTGVLRGIAFVEP